MDQIHQPTPYGAYPAEKKKSGCLKFAGIGCGILFLIAIIGGIVISLTWRQVVGSWIRKGMEAAAAEADLTEAERESLTFNIDRLTTAFEKKEIGVDDVEHIVEIFEKDKVGKVIMLRGIQLGIHHTEDISHDDLDSLDLHFSRIIRGLEEGQLTPKDFDDLLDNDLGEIFDKDKDNDRIVDPEKLKEFLPKLITFLDEKGISSEHYDYDLGAMLNELTDKILTRPDIHDIDVPAEATPPAEDDGK